MIVVYGARCVWWDTIDKVAIKANGLPCCPHCGSVLFQVDSEEAWFRNVDEHVKKSGDSTYRERLEWQRGKCFPTMAMATVRFYAERALEASR
jgi:hypothetical protein